MSPSIDMNNVLLVAGREIRQILKMKSFWLTLLILPVAFALGPIFAESLDDDEPTRVTVVDRSGGDAAKALEARFPGLGTAIEQTMSIAIDGVILPDAFLEKVDEDSEISILPKIGGGKKISNSKTY